MIGVLLTRQTSMQKPACSLGRDQISAGFEEVLLRSSELVDILFKSYLKTAVKGTFSFLCPLLVKIFFTI